MRRLFRLLLIGGFLAGAWALLRELLQQPSSQPTAQPSSEQPSGQGERTKARSGSDASGNGAASVSKAELYREAQKLDVEGRSKMTKDELADAVARARRSGG